MIELQLTDEQLERLADLVADRLIASRSADGEAAGSRLVTAAELAKRLGVARSFVYEHRDELGAIRLGGGPKAPLRFDVETANAAMARSMGGRSHGADGSDDGRSEPSSSPRRRRLPDRLPKPGAVLSIRGGA